MPCWHKRSACHWLNRGCCPATGVLASKSIFGRSSCTMTGVAVGRTTPRNVNWNGADLAIALLAIVNFTGEGKPANPDAGVKLTTPGVAVDTAKVPSPVTVRLVTPALFAPTISTDAALRFSDGKRVAMLLKLTVKALTRFTVCIMFITTGLGDAVVPPGAIVVPVGAIVVPVGFIVVPVGFIVVVVDDPGFGGC